MFYRINDRNIVNLEDISYVAVDMNQQGMWELRIFLKQVEHYMFINFQLEDEAFRAFDLLIAQLKFN